jgi:hypothetical protein
MRKSRNWLLVLLLIIVVTGFASFIYNKRKIGVSNGTRQIVFLTNGQIYFGNLLTSQGDFVTLRDVYYPQAVDSLRPDPSGLKKKITLQRLDEEIYAPDGNLNINKSQILYYENMRSDSKINDAINKFIQDNKNNPSPTASPVKP